MVFKYWVVDGKAKVIKDADRLVFNSHNELSVRYCISGRYEWKKLEFGKDFIQFTMAKE